MQKVVAFPEKEFYITDTNTTTKESTMKVHEIIIEQLGGVNRLVAMVGAHSFSYLKGENIPTPEESPNTIQGLFSYPLQDKATGRKNKPHTLQTPNLDDKEQGRAYKTENVRHKAILATNRHLNRGESEERTINEEF